ncbi:YSIRK-type signal peptide-containing protein [Lactobacillus iners]|uniref:YSIRK-type signal peptide-containing protein n=1 Tax=Lactobacillus iners TaxID=147802 RepID=UPI000C9B2CA9|nr:YSIRK-type signal peptide-containing protein [Lactobacillus iners]MDK8317245.1 YSIRK-type signal peptide-containing protein [Lactobacillus iners]MDK8323992.1 YSIRK-type signal peptide-containing protein [Lactobacillus iners]MDK8582211.1 YSIRK-type signal peptide-containing protein [Lactobacillus iners]PMC46819.1 signal peptide protein [Lactobacillus iners]
MKKERLDKFSIRKLTVGAASVLIGVAFGTTTVSAAAKPAPQQDTPASQQAAEVTALKDVKFTFKMGDKSATTRAVTIYATKDGHYGFTKDKCTYTAADITVAFLEGVSDSTIKSAQGIAYPEKINAGENTVEVAAKPASNKVEHSDADLQKEAEKKADELTNSPAFFKAELKDAEHDLQVAKDTVAQAEQEGSLSQEEMAKLQDDVAKAEAKVNELKNSSAFVEVQLKDAEHELEVAKDAVAQAEQEGGLSQEEMGKLQDEVAKAEAKVNELKAKVTPEPKPEPKPEETTYHFQYDDKKGTSIRQDYAAASQDAAEMHFTEYAIANGLDLDYQYLSYDAASHTFVYKDFESKKGEPEVQPELPVAPMPKTVYHFQYDDKKGTSIRQDFAAVNKEIAEMHFKEYATESGLVLDDAHFAYNEANQTFVYKDFESEKGEPEVLPVPAADVLAEAKNVAHAEFTKAGITGKIFHDAIDAAKTVEGLQAYVAETLKAHKTVEPVTPTPAPVVSGETGIGYLNLDMLSDGFTGTLYVPVVGKDVNCKVRLLDDAGKYTNDYVVTDTTVKALASKVVNGVTFYKVAENRWIPAKFAEVLSDKEVAFKGVAKTFVKGHANYAVAMLDADGKYTGKFLKQGSSFKVFAKKVINGHLCYRLGTQAQWVPARFLVF